MNDGADQPTPQTSDLDPAQRHFVRFRIGIFVLVIPAILSFAAARLLDVEVHRDGETSVYRLNTASAVLPAVAGLFCLVSASLIGTARVGARRALAILPALLALTLFGQTWDIHASHLSVGPDRLVLPAEGFVLRDHEIVLLSQIDAAIVSRKSETVQFLLRDGSTVSVPIGTLLREALTDCLAALEARDIPVTTLD